MHYLVVQKVQRRFTKRLLQLRLRRLPSLELRRLPLSCHLLQSCFLLYCLNFGEVRHACKLFKPIASFANFFAIRC